MTTGLTPLNRLLNLVPKHAGMCSGSRCRRSAERFAAPVTVTSDLAAGLYLRCGPALRHIALLTGQSAGTIRKRLRAAGIPLLPPAGCPASGLGRRVVTLSG